MVMDRAGNQFLASAAGACDEHTYIAGRHSPNRLIYFKHLGTAPDNGGVLRLVDFRSGGLPLLKAKSIGADRNRPDLLSRQRLADIVHRAFGKRPGRGLHADVRRHDDRIYVRA